MLHLKDMTHEQIHEYMNMLAQATELIMPGGPSPQGRALFAVLVFESETDEPGVHYVSNTEPEGVVAALRYMADRLEARATQSKLAPGD